ncbi:MAG: hypothetical protein LBS50_03375 [Prevotellaceae bacterium]|jgi:hypothetical protein|nr:hypothetical protein [Prevotellaceae bacterium]
MEEKIKYYELLPDSIIPPKEIIVDYAYGLIDGYDFCYEGYGLLALNAINAFIEKYPEVSKLQKIKASCLNMLGHDLHFIGLFTTLNNSNEVYYISELGNQVLQCKEQPELAWNFCSYLYSRCFTSISSSQATHEDFIAMMQSLLEKLPDNKHAQDYYAKGLLSICETSYNNDIINKYGTLLENLAKQYPDNENVIINYALITYLTLNKTDKSEYKLQLFEEIKRLADDFPDYKNLLSIKIFALLSMVISFDADNKKYIEQLAEIAEKKDEITELLGAFKWNDHYEHFAGLNQNKKYYSENVLKIAKMFPYFPDFVLVHKQAIINQIAYNGKSYFRNDFLKIIQTAAEKFPNKEEIQLLYAAALMWVAYRGDSDKRGQYIETLKVLSEKFPENQDIFAFYCMGISENFGFREENFYKTYFPVVENAYFHYPDNELICEAFVKGAEWLVREDLNNQTKNERKFSKAGDAFRVFPEMQKIAQKFPNNDKILELYTSPMENIYDYLPDMQAKKELIEEAIRFSKREKLWWNDIACNTYAVIEKYYLETENQSEKHYCFNEMCRIACDESDGEDHKWYITQTLEDIIYKLINEDEKDLYRQTMKRFCLENPDSKSAACNYAMQLVEKIQAQKTADEKQIIFNELKQWTLQYPGNWLVLIEYAEGLFEMAIAFSETEPQNNYIEQLGKFAKQYPIIVYKAGLEDKEQYKKIIDK